MEEPPSDPEAVILTEAEKAVVARLRCSGTEGFTRNDYYHLKKIREKCRNTLKHYDAAKNLFIEIDERMRG